MTPLVLRSTLEALKAKWSEETGLPLLLLREHAGREAAKAIARVCSQHHSASCIILVGPEDKGADGLAIARWLQHKQVPVLVYLCATRAQLSDKAHQQLHAAEAMGVQVVEGVPWSLSGEGKQLTHLNPHDVLVDALFETDFPDAGTPFWGEIIRAANQSCAYRISLDSPSGLEAHRGIPVEISLPSSAVINAHRTIALGYGSVGIYSSPGFVHAGEVEVVDLGLPAAWISGEGKTFGLVDRSSLCFLAIRGDARAHKGTHGHLAILAGSSGKMGAGWLATQAALQVGVGLCTWMLPESCPFGWQETVPESMTAIYGAAEDLIRLVEGKQACVVGPGFSTDPLARSVLEVCLKQTAPVPMVLDADALTILAQGNVSFLRDITLKRPVVLTPHPGEAARLLHTSAEAIQANRMDAACTLAEQTGATVVLKGPRTLIVTQDPQTRTLHCAINPTGNEQMGTAGMGDVLAGMIGALLLRGITPHEAACAAVYWHGITADELAAKRPPGVLLRAQELCRALPQTLGRLLSEGP